MKRRLRVVAWNVGRLYSRRRDNRLADEDVPRVAAVLHELDPDVALLQEIVDEVQLRAIAVRAGGGLVGAIAEKCAYDRHCAVLARRALEPAFEQLELAPTGRGVVMATVQAGPVRAAALTVHFDVFAPPRRRAQAQAVAALTDGRRERVVVVGGDFNFDPAWAARLGPGPDAESWRLLTERFVDAGHAAGPTLLGLFRVDHLLARGAAALHARVSPRRRLPLGDHDPVVCDVMLPGLVDADSRPA